MPRPAPPDADAVLAGLDPEQREVATTLRGPVCVLAGAGTGKTRAITHRIAYGVLTGVLPARHLLAVTFTTRAAGEMRGRLRRLGADGVTARTFHSAALRQLRYFWPRTVGGAPPDVIASKAGRVAEAAARCRVPADRALVRDLAAEVEWAKVCEVPPDGYPAAVEAAGRAVPGDLAAATVARVYAAYEKVKQDAGVIDFEDVLLLTVGMLADDEPTAAAVRDQYRFFVVDEYQDVSPLQQRLLDLWLGGRDDLCVVGDAGQTIYSFTGATPRFLLDFPTRHRDATVVRLVRDYRSTPQVVGLANAVLARAEGATSRARVELVAQRPDGPVPQFREHPDEPDEAQAVATEIRRLLDAGVPARDVAVLFRVNAQSEAYEEALTEAGLPYVLRGGERFFERPEVREAVMVLRGAARAGEGGAGLAADTAAVLASVGYRSTPPAGGGASRNRWESLAAVVALADELAAGAPDAGLAELVAELEERSSAQHAPAVDGVTLASLHSAKGLEWDAVFLVGLVDGTLPITYAKSPEQLEEERRLLYVGVTRAREHLALSWALARSPGGRPTRRPSRFLDGLRPAGPAEPARRPSRAGRRQPAVAHCRVCGRPLRTAAEHKLRHCDGCVVDIDLALFERLRSWRLDVAERAKVPAFVVFTDATLTAIAEGRPRTEADLVAIPGIGPSKLARYGADVLAIVEGSASS